MNLNGLRFVIATGVTCIWLLGIGQTVFSQIIEKQKVDNPIKLEALTPKLDLSKPKAPKMLQGTISDSYHPDILVIPRSGSGKAYEVGLKLYNDGDYRRALNAFKLAMIRGAKYGVGDPRVRNAKAAIKSTESKLNMQAELGYKTNNKNPKSLTGLVEKVFQPSLAWLGGLKKGDLITKAVIQGNVVKLTVKRKGKIYHLNLTIKRKKSKKLNLQAMAAKKDRPKRDGFSSLKAGRITNSAIITKNEKLLARYDCALLVDTSGSMAGPIRVKDSVNQLNSRWGWCQENCVGFYNKAKGYFPNGLTLIPFNDRFAVARRAKSSEINQVFDKLKPNGGTNISSPLAFVLDDYFRRRNANSKVKPLAIAVMTDGQVSVNRIRDVVLDATSKMRYAQELKITFLSIGNDSFGAPTLKALDDDLVNVGAAYDIVDTRYFDEILQYGLLKVIVAALIENKAEGK